MYIFDEWLRYLEKPDEKREPYWEYEFQCRVHLIGVLDMGWAYFQFWEIPPPKNKSDVRSVVLRMRYRDVDREESLKVPIKNEQHYHPKGPPGDFESLISLFTRAHFVLTNGSFSGNSPQFRRFVDQESVAYSDVDGSQFDLRNVQKYFNMMLDIRKSELNMISKQQPHNRFVKKIIMAARFYHLALSLIEHDDTLAYICLVSSIECMLESEITEQYSLKNVNLEAYELLREAIPNKNVREPIEKAILKHEPKIKQRFVSFISDNISDAFWNDNTRPPESFRFKNDKDIAKFVRRIYDTRSSAIHRGEPFPSLSLIDEEDPIAHGMKIGQKEWKEKEMIPSVRAFERLVHHVLLESLSKQHSKLIN